MKRDFFLTHLDKYLSVGTYQDYCPNGLQVEGSQTITKVAFSVSATLEAIEKTIEAGFDTLITHHGIIWKYQANKTITGAHYNRVSNLIKNNINLISYHLPLDGHMEVGNAVSLAKLLGLKSLGPFGEYKRSNIGAKGEFTEKLSAGELKEKLQIALDHDVISSAKEDQKIISNVGIITGGANNEWELAKNQGLDAYITGEISEYNWHDAREAGVAYFAGGHHATEKFGIQALMKYCRDSFQIETLFIDSNNPA